ncbi:MAG TPA: hypothetical protein VM760_08920 [Sphingomicrobium sp.]|jgi:hypothetical protein|nr:hypothetical protein [Sphingomicrobium sp.]
MRPLLKKTIGAVGGVGLAALEGAILVVQAIGLTTTADDAKNLPRLVNAFLETPWWVSSLVVPTLLAAVAFWAFAPDRSFEKARIDLKESNDRAWAFEPEFRATLEQVTQSKREILDRFETLQRMVFDYEKMLKACEFRIGPMENTINDLSREVAALQDALGARRA